MKSFIKKTTIVSLLFTVLIILFCYLNISYFKSNFNFKINDKIIILGLSHPACAYNDEYIENVTNLSQSGEPYFYTYYKVKELISQNKIETILLEYTNYQINQKQNEWVWGDNSMNAYLPRHLSFMSKNEINLLYNKNSNFLSIFSSSIKKILIKNLTNKLSINNDYGGYEILSNGLKNEDEVTTQKTNDSINPVSKSDINIEYLAKIDSLCKTHEINLIFIRSPQHEKYDRRNEKTLIQVKEQNFKEIDYLDFDKFPIADNEFSDYGHLNKFGAKKISIWLNKLIQNGLLSQKDKSQIVKKEIEKYKSLNFK